MFKVVFKLTSLPNYQIGDKFEEIEGNFHFRPILNTSEKTTKLLQLTTSLAHISTLLERHSEQLFLPPERGPVVVIHSIPIRLTPNEFLHSIPGFKEQIDSTCFIQTHLNYKYFGFIRFKEIKQADDFVKKMNGKLFEKGSCELCRVGYLKFLKFEHPPINNNKKTNFTTPNFDLNKKTKTKTKKENKNLNEPDSQCIINEKVQKGNPKHNNEEEEEEKEEEINDQKLQKDQDQNQKKDLKENIEKGREVGRGRGKKSVLNTKENQLINQKLWVELPLCPSCFERLDQEVVNIPYNWNVEKQFSKRGKWEGNRCEVCEHCKEFSKEHTEFKKFLTINCEYCSSKNDLWVCLICGTKGCGRYNGGHAYQHFQQTSHYFTMELSTQRIWDYYTETYVHRLITGPDCDILIEFPHKKAQGKKNYQSVEEKEEFYSAIIQSKCESLANEYEYMISNQLEEQRTFFEDHIMTIKEKILKKQKIERQRIEKKFNLVKNEERRFNNEMKSLQNNRTENLTLNQELCKKQKNLVLIKEEFETKLQNKVLEQQREIQDLKEQIRDLNFFLKSQIAIQESQIKDEIKTGKIIISKNQKKRSRNRRNRRNRRKN
ncbi:brca1-associated protein [Anaeramoeba flamelloides]|uniref:Brca1-associated protein n=1 Tax=Anaeramoeba flamelloides TaxID=1746091 RepID=A0ABQ8YDJ5_9EUKA|nr:brca1-associated protein [Anaeramoeba flamelloides]